MFFVFHKESTFFKYAILSIVLVSEQIKLLNVEINCLDIIGIIQWQTHSPSYGMM